MTEPDFHSLSFSDEFEARVANLNVRTDRQVTQMSEEYRLGQQGLVEMWTAHTPSKEAARTQFYKICGNGVPMLPNCYYFLKRSRKSRGF